MMKNSSIICGNVCLYSYYNKFNSIIKNFNEIKPENE